jgi:non-specific serine/threonine protein kinase
MLETVRQYGKDKLEAAGGAEATILAHFLSFLNLAETASKYLTGPEQAVWLKTLDLDRENLLAAYGACSRIDDGVNLGVRLVQSLRLYWLNAGLLGLGLRICQEALDRVPATSRNRTRCLALHTAGQFAYFVGLYSRARSLLKECLDIAQENSDEEMIASTLHRLGIACWGAKDLEAARRYLDEAVRAASLKGAKRELAVAQIALAQLHRSQRNNHIALELYLKAGELVRGLGDYYGTAVALINAVMAATEVGDLSAAKLHLRALLDVAPHANSLAITQSLLDAVSGVAAEMGKWSAVAALHSLAEEIASETGCARDPADQAFIEPRIAAARDAIGVSQFRIFGEGRAEFRRASLYLDIEKWIGECDLIVPAESR